MLAIKKNKLPHPKQESQVCGTGFCKHLLSKSGVIRCYSNDLL